MLYEAVCGYFQMKPKLKQNDFISESKKILTLEKKYDSQESIRECILNAYDIRSDDENLREILHLPLEQAAAHFDGLRKNYPRRKEFDNYLVCSPDMPLKISQQLQGLGFHVSR